MTKGKHLAFIGLGSNIDPEMNLIRALKALRQRTRVLATSSPWRSPAAGAAGPDFLNVVIKIETELLLEELKTLVLRPIESHLGRTRTLDKNAPRTIDLDILIFDELEIDPDLWETAHIAVPLSEIFPVLVRAKDGLTLEEAALRLKGHVKKHSMEPTA